MKLEEHDTITMFLQMDFICCAQFFLKTKSCNYQNLVNELLASYHILRCSVNIKLHYLKSHSDKFPDNLGDVSEVQGEVFTRT